MKIFITTAQEKEYPTKICTSGERQKKCRRNVAINYFCHVWSCALINDTAHDNFISKITFLILFLISPNSGNREPTGVIHIPLCCTFYTNFERKFAFVPFSNIFIYGQIIEKKKKRSERIHK